MFEVGDKVRAFNGAEWMKTGDIGDNSQFMQEAEIINIRWHRSPFYDEPEYVADLIWKHNNQVSRGHFIRGLKKIIN